MTLEYILFSYLLAVVILQGLAILTAGFLGFIVFIEWLAKKVKGD